MRMCDLRSGIAAAACLIVLAGCATSIPTRPKAVVEPPLSRSIPAPAGWLDVTDKALSPDVEYWFLAGDRSASLLLKELQLRSPAGSAVSHESLVTLAHVSLRLKFADRGSGLRVTQAPSLVESNPAFAMYSYAEQGLLRRVLVFRKQSRLFELELAQEREDDVFASHLAAQFAFAQAVLRQ